MERAVEEQDLEVLARPVMQPWLGRADQAFDELESFVDPFDELVDGLDDFLHVASRHAHGLLDTERDYIERVIVMLNRVNNDTAVCMDEWFKSSAEADWARVLVRAAYYSIAARTRKAQPG